MQILIIPSWYPIVNNQLSGIFFKEQAEALAKQNLDIGCIAINESSLRYIFSQKEISFDFYEKSVNGVDTINILYPIVNRLNRLRSFIRKFVFKILFKRYIKKYGKPDLVHLHSFLYGSLAIWIKETYNINYVVTEHSTGFARELYNTEELSYAKGVFSNSKYNICVSNEFKKLLEKIFDDEFHYIPNAIDTDFFIPKVTGEKTFSFINIAFLDKKKNQSMLIQAFSKAFTNKDVTLTIVGSGAEYNTLNNFIMKLNMQKQIKLYGAASRDEVLELLQNSDAFVLSSEYETFGVVIIEAMSCGLPVVATKCGGPESIVMNDKLGKLVDIDVDSLSKGMLELYTKKYDSKYIRTYVIDNFSADIVSEKLLNVYNRQVGI